MPVKSLGVHGNRSIVAVCGVVPVAAIVPSFPVDTYRHHRGDYRTLIVVRVKKRRQAYTLRYLPLDEPTTILSYNGLQAIETAGQGALSSHRS